MAAGAAARGALAAAAALALAAPAAARLKVQGSTTVNPVVVEAAAALAAERGIDVVVDTLGGSSGGIAALAAGRADVAMSSRPLAAGDAERYPGVDFQATAIGVDAVALVVSRDVWQGGVRAVTRAEAAALYEGRIAEWSALGGPRRRVVFFSKEPGRGTWEVFTRWLYGDSARAPLVALPEVGSNEEARAKVASTPGAITQLSAAWADGERVFALGLAVDGGTVVRPTPESLALGAYPLARPLLLVTRGAPAGEARLLIDRLLAPAGQEIVRRHGYLPLAAAAGGGVEALR